MTVNILWMGGEDIDFPNGTTIAVTTTAGYFRSGYARCAVQFTSGGSGMAKSTLFPGGDITSAWLSFQMKFFDTEASQIAVGFGKSGTTKGIFFGSNPSTANKGSIYTYDGSTWTVLASESGTSIDTSLVKIDMQLTSYGGSSNIKVYFNNVLIIDFTGDSSISGISGFDSVYIPLLTSSQYNSFSEIIVSDSDTRAFNLQTYYPSGAGTTNDWDSGDYGDIDEEAVNDADLAFSNTVDKDLQTALSNTASGSFSVYGVKIASRATSPASSTANKLKQGFFSGGSVDVDAGQALTTAWATYERYLTSINGGQITTALLDSAELDLRSAS